MPASSSVVWPAYGAVRARDVGRDRMDLMYSPMLVRLHNRKQLPGDAVHRPGAATLLLRTKLTPYCSAQRNDCAYAMNPASDVDGRMVCSWLLYMSRHAVSILTLCHTHSLTALHSLRWHMALAQTSRTHNMQTVQRGEGGWEAHRRDAEGSHGRGYNGTA